MPQKRDLLEPDREDKLATLIWLDLFNAAKNRQEKNLLLEKKPHASFEKVKAWLDHGSAAPDAAMEIAHENFQA